MRSLGTMLSTSVQAERHGPSITTRLPDSRTRSNRSRNGPTFPPGLPRMRISVRAGAAARALAIAAIKIATRIPVRTMAISFRRVRPDQNINRTSGGKVPSPGQRGICFAQPYRSRAPTEAKAGFNANDTLTITPGAAQGRQSDAGGVEAAIDGENLSGDVARTIAAQEEHGLRQLFFEAVPVERDRVMIVGADFRAMDRFRHCGVDRARGDAIDADAERSQFDRELFGQMGKPRLAGAVGRAQR